jgi:hypothetical protein
MLRQGQHYSPVNYWSPAVWPRDALRKPYPRRVSSRLAMLGTLPPLDTEVICAFAVTYAAIRAIGVTGAVIAAMGVSGAVIEANDVSVEC